MTATAAAPPSIKTWLKATPLDIVPLLPFMTASEKADLGAMMRFASKGEYIPTSADDLPIPELSIYANRPKDFLTDILGVKPEHWYKEIEEVCQSLVDNRETDVPAGHGVGKTFYVGRLVIWWVFARGGSFVTTAPGLRQVRRLLWKEIRRAHAKLQARFGKTRTGRCDATQLVVTPWHYGYGFAAPEWNPDAALGEHDAKLLVVADEANAIGPAIWDSLNSLTTGEANRRLNLSNPTAPDTPFHKSCRRADLPGEHKTIKIAVWKHPNLTNKTAIIPGAVTKHWVEKVRNDYTEMSSYWRSRVEAEFPDESESSLVPRSVFEVAIRRFSVNSHVDTSKSTPFSVGMDVGESRDRTVFTGIVKMCLTLIIATDPVSDDREIARGVGFAKDILNRLPAGSSMQIDGTGCGAGTVAMLLEDDYNVESIKFGSKSSDTEEFKLMRDELAWRTRMLFMRGLIAVRPPRTVQERQYLEALKDDLASMRWDRDARGRFFLIKKDKIKEILGRSPDFGDSLLFAAAKVELPGGLTESIMSGFEGINLLEP